MKALLNTARRSTSAHPTPPGFRIRPARLLAACALAAWAGVAGAQGAYPSQPIRFIVPYAAGGLPDVVIRQIGAKLGERFPSGVVVENKPGAGGVNAVQTLLAAPPDGYTFVFSDAAMVSVSPLILKSLPYDTKKDLIPVSYTARAPNFVVVNPSVPANTFAEFVELVKSRPGKVSCGSSGVGSVHHLTLELIKSSLKIDIVHVPFRGSGQSVPALLGGQIDCLMASLAPITGAVSAGKMRILAFAGTSPSPLAPNVPAIGAAMNGFDSAFLLGAFGRNGVPAEIVRRVSAEMAAAAKLPDVASGMARLGVEPVGGGPREFAEALRIDGEQMANAVKVANIRPD